MSDWQKAFEEVFYFRRDMTKAVHDIDRYPTWQPWAVFDRDGYFLGKLWERDGRRAKFDPKGCHAHNLPEIIGDRNAVLLELEGRLKNLTII